MDPSQSPSTLLDAVNVLLATISEAPVTSIDSPQNASAATALNTLYNVSRRVQSAGWAFNTELNFKLTPDASGYLVLPENTLRADTVGQSETLDLVQRGGKLYDRVNHTFVFTEPVYADLLVCLSFDDLPQAAKDYVTVRAARVFQAQQLGSNTVFQFTELDERDALVTLKDHEGDTADANMLDGVGSYRPMSVLDRAPYPRGGY